MLEYPGLRPAWVIPVGQDRLRDFSAEGIERRRKAGRDSLALVKSIDREIFLRPSA